MHTSREFEDKKLVTNGNEIAAAILIMADNIFEALGRIEDQLSNNHDVSDNLEKIRKAIMVSG